MQLSELVAASERVADTSKRLEKVDILSHCLRRVEPQEASVCASFLCGELPHGKLGVGYAVLREIDAPPAADPELTLRDVHAQLGAVANVTGKGSKRRRGEILYALFSRATAPEQVFLRKLLLGELRQGALEGILLDAVANATDLDGGPLRRALLFAGDVREVAVAALAHGAEGLDRFRLTLMQPLSPMLAQPGGATDDALDRLGASFGEFKIDGARIQVHKQDDEVRVFSRSLKELTSAVPEIVERVHDLPARRLILDGEAIALRKDGAPLPFQVTMRRFGRKLDVEPQRKKLPLSCFFFDCLHLDGQDLVDVAYVDRTKALSDLVPATELVPREEIRTKDDLEAFFGRALEAGHEGVMAKAANSPYSAGRRGASWLKLKPSHTLDLVVLAAEWGSGRRTGLLSNLHLGARDPDSGGFVMLGKTFKGLTDALLEFQTQQLLAREIGRDSYTVFVKPELVVEIAFDGVQASPHYPGGVALRFARVKRYRDDKQASEADTIGRVRELHRVGHRSAG